MKITVIAVGKLKEKYLKQGIEEYVKRLSRFCRLEIIEVKDEKAPENISNSEEGRIRKTECDRILGRLKEGAIIVSLDINGEKFNSNELAQKIQAYMNSGRSHITFVIGGSLGLNEKVLQKSDLRFSLSDMTFPHQLARLVLMEQLFRVFKIINNEPYHK